MKEKERVTKVLKGCPVDRPPFICPGGMMNMVTTEIMDKIGDFWPKAHLDAAALARLAEGVHVLTGIENLGVPFCMTIEAEAMGAKVSLGSIGNEPMIEEYPLKKIYDFTRLNNIQRGSGRVDVVMEAIGILADRNPDTPIIANLTGPISLATSLIEPMVLFKAMGKEPEQVHKFLNFIAENLIAFGRLQLEAGASILTISDPSGTGEILGPNRFSEFAMPYINQILEELKGLYEASMVHICGNLRSIFPQINLLKTTAISIDSSTKVEKIANALNGKVIVGNVSTHMLLKGKPESVERTSLSCIRRGAAVLSPACGISPKTPLNNLKAMSKAVKKN